MDVCILSPLALPKMQDQKLLTLCWLSFTECGREYLSLVFDYKGDQYIQKDNDVAKSIILRLTVGYLNATILRKTRNPVLEIGTDRCRKSCWNVQVDGYGYSSRPSRGSRSGLWMGLGPKGSMFVVQTRTAGRLCGPFANTTFHYMSGSCLIQVSSSQASDMPGFPFWLFPLVTHGSVSWAHSIAGRWMLTGLMLLATGVSKSRPFGLSYHSLESGLLDGASVRFFCTSKC